MSLGVGKSSNMSFLQGGSSATSYKDGVIYLPIGCLSWFTIALHVDELEHHPAFLGQS
jgi:hypothetical protein